MFDLDIQNAVEQGHTLTLSKTGNENTLKLKAKTVDQMGLTGAFPKSRVEGVIIRDHATESTHSLFLIFKEAEIYYSDCIFGDEKYTQSIAERYYERWKYLKSIGIPVVSSMRVADNEKVAMGNMLIDGGQFIGKDTYWWSEPSKRDREKNGLTLEERLFLNIDPSNIKKEISRILNIAWKNGVRLPDTDEEFSVLVKPDGTWSIVVKDIGTINKLQPDDNFVGLEKELHKRVDYIRNELTQHKYVKRQS